MLTFAASEECVQGNLCAEYLSYSAGIDLTFMVIYMKNALCTSTIQCFSRSLALKPKNQQDFLERFFSIALFFSFCVFTLHPSSPFLLEPCNDPQLAREESDSRTKHGHKWRVDI